MNQDFKELLEVFNEEKVKYLIVGGFAVIRHTEPRSTKDLEIWFGIDGENAERVYRALVLYGAPVAELTVRDFRQPGHFFMMGLPPHRIDILFDLIGLDFEMCWERRVVGEFDGVPTQYIAAEDLITNKEAVGRLQDLADAEKLRIAQVRAGKSRIE